MKKRDYIIFRKTALEHSNGYDIIQLLSINKLVVIIEDERKVIIGKYGAQKKKLTSILADS